MYNMNLHYVHVESYPMLYFLYIEFSLKAHWVDLDLNSKVLLLFLN